MKPAVMRRGFSVVLGLTFILVGTGWADVEPMVKKTSDGVSYITGGVGKDERAELKKLFTDYTCRIELANKKGEYLYKGRILLRDSNGKEILETDTAGPWLLVDLDEGEYTAVVVHRGTEQKLKISVQKGKKKVVIVRF